MQKTWVQSQDQEDPLEKEIATHYSILAWEIPWAEEPGGLRSVGYRRVGHDLVTKQQQQLWGPFASPTAEAEWATENLVSKQGWEMKDTDKMCPI